MDNGDEQNIKLWRNTYKNVNTNGSESDYPFDLRETFFDNEVEEMTEENITFSRKEQIDLDNEISESEKISFNQIIKNHNLNTEQQKAFLLYVSTVFDKDVAHRLI